MTVLGTFHRAISSVVLGIVNPFSRASAPLEEV